ncbi:Spy/CpxP family protein refolding chaperone [Arsenicibacter rosenii]|uniref:Periplasmic heavy metal sensor n=1 Tax=Arsenicibacter rosenii TaxID=1750698 RepID=A0A1S2VK82_9BACT|nr:periplasmic heavy metal sensor [Arsenicibacter rosenii]OIN59164.1 hypothetical protein BLX24_09195 [Arsenicibacter rosenii]
METKTLIRWLSGVIALLVLLNLGLIGWMFFARSGMPPGGGGPVAFRFLERELSLTDTQEQQVIASREALSERSRPLEDSARALRKQLFTLTRQTPLPVAETDQLSRQLGGLIAQLERNRLQHFKEIRDVLTPEQQSRFDSILDELAQRQGPPPGNGHRPPGGPSGPPEGPPGP